MQSSVNNIEWEYLSKTITIQNISINDEEYNEIDRITISRNDEYKIEAIAYSACFPRKILEIQESIPGKEIAELSIVGYDKYNNRFFLSGCIITGKQGRINLLTGNSHIEQVSLLVHSLSFKDAYMEKEEKGVLIDWYLNACNIDDIFCERATVVSSNNHDIKYSEFEISAHGQEEKTFFGSLTINCIDSCKIIVIKSENKHIPSWSKGIGVAYIGNFPNKKIREKIITFIGFLLNRKLFLSGTTYYDMESNVLEAKSFTPDSSVKYASMQATCTIINYSWSSAKKINSIDTFKKVVNSLLPMFINKCDEMKLNDAIHRIFISNLLPLESSLPILVNGIEIVKGAWLKNTSSTSNGTYMTKDVYDKIISDSMDNIEKQILEKSPKYGDRIVNNIKRAFCATGSKSYDLFFEETNIKTSKKELESINKRNHLIHGAMSYDAAKLRNVSHLTKVARVFISRIILILLGYTGKYSDFSIEGFPCKDISIPAHEDVSQLT